MHRIKSAQLIEQDSRKKADFNLDIYAKKQGHFGSGEMIELHANIHTHLGACPRTKVFENKINI